MSHKYQAELNKTGTLTEHIGALKTQLEEKVNKLILYKKKLKLFKIQSKEQQDQLVTEKSQIETDLSLSNNRIAELKEQNDILLNQLELTKIHLLMVVMFRPLVNRVTIFDKLLIIFVVKKKVVMLSY